MNRSTSTARRPHKPQTIAGAAGMAAAIRVERSHSLYSATGSRAELINSGLAGGDWFPQGKKRHAYGDRSEFVDGKMTMTWRVRKCAGDCFELTIWHATEAQRAILDALLPAEAVQEDFALRRHCARMAWERMIDTTWSMASKSDDFRLSAPDQERLLEALRSARAILKTGVIVDVKQQQLAFGAARRDPAFQQFMAVQGLGGHTAGA